MLKKFIFVLFSIVLIFLFTNNSYAQSPTPASSGGCTEAVCMTPSFEEINGNTPFVEITFNGLEDRTWYHCSILNEDCDGDLEGKISGSGETRTVKVCAASDKRLRVGDDCNDNSGIYDGDDYFHEGRAYQLTLYEDDKKETRGPTVLFYVNHYFPKATITAGTGSPLEVVITGDRRLGPSKSKNRNNYQVVVEGEDNFGNKWKDDRCIGITENNGSAVAKFGRNDNEENTQMRPGKYVVKVNEQIGEGGVRGVFDKCGGGFTFWHAEIEVDNKGNMTPPQLICSDKSSLNCTKDPNASDLEALNELLGKFGEFGKFTLLCDKVLPNPNKDGKLECVSIDTAIGSIPTNPIAFIERLFSIVLSLAGIGALGLLIYGGYKYMISRGDPEAIKGARETITSAILGLLFIIFSLVILQVIAGDILNIPGFNSP